MKKYLFLIISCLVGLFLPITNYVELNHLLIVESIALDCKNNYYHLYLKEIIPKKGNNDINYQYKIYQDKGNSLNKAYQNIINNTSKKIFIKDTKKIITNCQKTNDILNYFSLKNTTIIYSKKDLKKELSKS